MKMVPNVTRTIYNICIIRHKYKDIKINSLIIKNNIEKS